MPLVNVFGNVPGAQPGVSSTDFSNVGAGVSDIFAGFAAGQKAAGAPAQRALPAESAMPVLRMEPPDESSYVKNPGKIRSVTRISKILPHFRTAKFRKKSGTF